MRITPLVQAGALALMTLTACGSEADVVNTPAPLASDADGATVYAARCASCHGDDLRGTDKGPTQLSIVYEPGHHGDESYRRAIRNGAPEHHFDFGDMEPIEDITDEQIERVISYIRSEQERLGFEP